MRITHVSTSDVQGGAARAAYRLHRGLIGLGEQSLMLSVHKASPDETVRQIRPWREPDDLEPAYLERLQQRYINSNRTPISNTLFTLPYPGCDLTGLQDVATSDVINLHWVAFLQSPISLDRLLRLDKPVVWTLHDMWAFTGGCHFSAGCARYEQDCLPCPQLREDPYRLPAAILNDRLSIRSHPRLVVVTPSHWLGACARRSLVFRHTRVEVIPNSLETDIFAPMPKAEAKRLLGMSPDTAILLAGAHDGNERRKGFRELTEALRTCAGDSGFQELVRRGKVKLLSFGLGIGPRGGDMPGVPVVPLGLIGSDDKLCQIYSAADIFVLPSLDDNLPNTMLEAMSCGTPVVAFGVGGIPEVLEDGVTGRIVPPGAAPRMAAAILDCLRDHDAMRKMGAAARRVIETGHSLPVQARRYHDLYRELVGAGGTLTAPIVPQRDAAVARTTPQRSGMPPDVLPVPVDCSLGPAFEPIFHRWAIRAAQTDLEQAHVRLGEAKAELARSQAEVETLRAPLAQVKAELARSQAALATREGEVTALRSQVDCLEGAHRELDGRIAAMESSKFWKLRRRWFAVKRAVGLPCEE